jgi:hypothetical protein
MGMSDGRWALRQDGGRRVRGPIALDGRGTVASRSRDRRLSFWKPTPALADRENPPLLASARLSIFRALHRPW